MLFQPRKELTDAITEAKNHPEDCSYALHVFDILEDIKNTEHRWNYLKSIQYAFGVVREVEGDKT